MENDINIALSEECRQNPTQALADLFVAADAISKAAETEFQAIKDTNWYKRLWQLVTFSKDNEKKLACGVSNLAKLSEIVMRAVLLLSKESAELSAEVCKNNKILDALVQKQNTIAAEQGTIIKGQIAILNKIRQIESNLEEDITFDTLDMDEKIVFVSAFASACDSVPYTNNDTVALYTEIIRLCGRPQEISLNFIEKYSVPKAMLLYRAIMEYVYLAQNNFELDAEVLEYICIANSRKKSIQQGVERIYRLGGADAVIKCYSNGVDFTLLYADDIEWITDETSEDLSEPTNENDSMPMDHIPEESECENVYLNDMLHVSPGECLSFENKNIFLQTTIGCEGSLSFVNCNVFYGTENHIGGIILHSNDSDNGSIAFENCRIKNQNWKDQYFINQETTKKAEFSFSHCEFIDCEYFMLTWNANVFIKDSCIINPGQNFIYDMLNSEISVQNSKFLLKYKEMDEQEEGVTAPIICVDHSKVNIVGCDFSSNIDVSSLENLRDIRRYQARHKGDIVKSRNLNVIKSKFCNLYDIFTYGGTIADSEFSSCYSVICGNKYGRVDAQIPFSVRGCKFTSCGLVAVHLNKGSIIEYCHFNDCIGQLISSAKYGGIVVSTCQFDKCVQENHPLSYSMISLHRESFAADTNYCKIRGDKLIRYRWAEVATEINSIKNCLFKNIQIPKGYFVAGALPEVCTMLDIFGSNGYSADKLKAVAEVNNCKFENCTITGSWGSFVTETGHYYENPGKRNEKEITVRICKVDGLIVV